MYHPLISKVKLTPYYTFMLLCILGLCMLETLLPFSKLASMHVPSPKSVIVSFYDLEGNPSRSGYGTRSDKMELKSLKHEDVRETEKNKSANIESNRFVNLTNSIRNLTSPVLLTTANYGFLNLLFNFLASIQRLSVTPTILILCEDKTAYVKLLERQRNFGLNYQLALTHLQESSTNASTYNTSSYIKLVKKRVSYIEILMQENMDVLYIDADIVLLADPFKYFMDDNYDIFFQWDKTLACSGFFYMKAKQTTREFVKQWRKGLSGDQLGNQMAFNKAMEKCKEKIKKKGLPKHLFMSGYEFEKVEVPWYLMAPQPVQIHANFMKGKNTKVDWLKKNELWFSK